MSQPYEPNTTGGPSSRPDGNGIPPGVGKGGFQPPGADDSVDPGVAGEGGDIGQDAGGMIGEG